MKTVHGIKVDEITYAEPGNNLPVWVKQAAATRGYGDSMQSLSLFVTEGDIEAAFDCAAQGNGSSCVMAQAGQRIGAKAVYFYRSRGRNGPRRPAARRLRRLRRHHRTRAAERRR